MEGGASSAAAAPGVKRAHLRRTVARFFAARAGVGAALPVAIATFRRASASTSVVTPRDASAASTAASRARVALRLGDRRSASHRSTKTATAAAPERTFSETPKRIDSYSG